MTALVVIPASRVRAVSRVSISPATLSASGQKFEVTYSGLRTGHQGSSLAVEECIADDRKSGFNPAVDCSSLSRQFFYGLSESGTLTYGGNAAANPTAPFVGIDPENGAWSICDPDSGANNYQSGYLRLAESPSDRETDAFVRFTCAATGARGEADAGGSGTSSVVLAGGAGAVVLGCILAIARRRQRPKSSTRSR